MTKIPPDDILEELYELRIRESEKLKTVSELYNMVIHQKKAGPDYHRLKTMVKRSIEQGIRNKNFEARNGNYERNAVVKSQGTKQRNPSPNSFMQQNERNASRTRSPRGKSPSGRMYRWPCKDYLKGTCNNSFCERWHPLECLFYKTKNCCRFGRKCSYAHRQVDEQPTERSKKNDDISAVAMLKKGDWHESVREPVINYGHDRSGRPDKKRARHSTDRDLESVFNVNAWICACQTTDRDLESVFVKRKVNAWIRAKCLFYLKL